MATENIVSMSGMRVPEFDGKQPNYPVFWSRFNALANVKGFRQALDPSFRSKLPATEATVLDASNSSEKEQIKAVQLNAIAYSYLTMASTAPRLLAKLENSKTADWPGGLAYVYVEKLEKQYRPKDILAVAEQMKSSWD